MRLTRLLCLLTLLVIPLSPPIATAQSDPYTPIITLLNQAATALDSNDLSTAQALMP